MTDKEITRRRFLKLSAGALGAGALVYLSMRQPKVEIIDTHHEGEDMKKNILVAYAGRAGSTAGVADEIGKTLVKSGASVDVRPVKEVSDLSSYQAVVVGSAIRTSKWLPEAMDFLRVHQMELNAVPFAAFQVCMTLAMPNKDYREFVAGWFEPVRKLVKPVSEGMFAGVIDYSKLSFADGVGMRVFAAATKTTEGDYRDWDAIRAWAASLPAQL